MALSPLSNFCVDEMKMEVNPPDASTGRSVWKFAKAKSLRIPMHCRTGYQAMGNPTERKKFRQIEFHGTGTVYCRVYVDNVYICEGSITMTEVPSKDRRLGLPIGTRGYAMDLEFACDGNLRAIEYAYSPMKATS